MINDRSSNHRVDSALGTIYQALTDGIINYAALSAATHVYNKIFSRIMPRTKLSGVAAGDRDRMSCTVTVMHSRPSGEATLCMCVCGSSCRPVDQSGMTSGRALSSHPRDTIK